MGGKNDMVGKPTIVVGVDLRKKNQSQLKKGLCLTIYNESVPTPPVHIKHHPFETVWSNVWDLHINVFGTIDLGGV